MSLALSRTQACMRTRKSNSYLLFSGSGRREESIFGRPQMLDSSRISLEDSGEESDTRRLVSSRVSPGIAPFPEDRKRRRSFCTPLSFCTDLVELQDVHLY